MVFQTTAVNSNYKRIINFNFKKYMALKCKKRVSDFSLRFEENKI
jgi:hypothetical protein